MDDGDSGPDWGDCGADAGDWGGDECSEEAGDCGDPFSASLSWVLSSAALSESSTYIYII